MMFCKFIFYDLKHGLLVRWTTYAMTFLIFMVVCLPLPSLHQRVMLDFPELPPFTFGDYILYLFSGCKEYIPTAGEKFYWPTLWVFALLLFLYLILYYPYRELMGFGKQMIVLTQRRAYWWLSKCIWTILSAFLYFIVLIFAAIAMGYMMGADHQFAVSSISPYLFPFNLSSLPQYPWNLFSFLLAVPCVFTVLGILELLLSLILRPVFSFVIIAAYVLLGTYFMSPVFIGNFAMAARSEVFTTGGMQPNMGVLICCFATAVAVFAGWLYFRQMDIINKER